MFLAMAAHIYSRINHNINFLEIRAISSNDRRQAKGMLVCVQRLVQEDHKLGAQPVLKKMEKGQSCEKIWIEILTHFNKKSQGIECTLFCRISSQFMRSFSIVKRIFSCWGCSSMVEHIVPNRCKALPSIPVLLGTTKSVCFITNKESIESQ